MGFVFVPIINFPSCRRHCFVLVQSRVGSGPGPTSSDMRGPSETRRSRMRLRSLCTNSRSGRSGRTGQVNHKPRLRRRRRRPPGEAHGRAFGTARTCCVIGTYAGVNPLAGSSNAVNDLPPALLNDMLIPSASPSPSPFSSDRKYPAIAHAARSSALASGWR